MTYAEKLKDPRWQKKRLEILERDKWSCRHCGSPEKTLHVHHKFYARKFEPWDYPDYAYIALCEDCHEATELTKKQVLLYFASFPSTEVSSAIMALWEERITPEEISRFAKLLSGYESSEEAFTILKEHRRNPSVKDVIDFAKFDNIPPEFSKWFHTLTTEQNGWIINGEMVDWRHQIIILFHYYKHRDSKEPDSIESLDSFMSNDNDYSNSKAR